MARAIKRLSPRTVSTVKAPGLHADGGGLYLRVNKQGSKQWTFIFTWQGKRREMGLGGVNSVSLPRAREKASDARALVADGLDPVAARRIKRTLPNFGQIADDFVSGRSASLRNVKSVERIKRALGPKGYAESLRSLRLDQIHTDDVLAILTPIWNVKPSTAKGVRGYIENVLDAAKARGYLTGENPARWTGHLDHLLPKPKRLTRGHHPAIPYSQIQAFVRDLRTRQDRGRVGWRLAFGLELLILTAARSGEVINAVWGEFDLEQKVWTVPAARSKTEREHRVPLSERTIDILKEMGPSDKRAALILEHKPGAPYSNMAFSALMDRMGWGQFTTHGMRSTFRDWVGEETVFPREVAEAALSHAVGDAAELAYRRGDALEKRRKLMAAWAEFCG